MTKNTKVYSVREAKRLLEFTFTLSFPKMHLSANQLKNTNKKNDKANLRVSTPDVVFPFNLFVLTKLKILWKW